MLLATAIRISFKEFSIPLTLPGLCLIRDLQGICVTDAQLFSPFLKLISQGNVTHYHMLGYRHVPKLGLLSFLPCSVVCASHWKEDSKREAFTSTWFLSNDPSCLSKPKSQKTRRNMADLLSSHSDGLSIKSMFLS